MVCRLGDRLFLLGIPFVICSQWVRLRFGLSVFYVCCRDPGDCLFLVCCVAIPAAVFPSCLCGLAALVSREVFLLVMGSDCFETQKKKSWVWDQVRTRRILADAITIDGGKEWTNKFCSETNVWTRWRCRRCGNNILSGLQSKHKQAMCANNREWYSGSSF